MTNHDREQFIKTLSPEQREYFHVIEEATAKAESVQRKHPEFDIQDLINIVLFQRLTPEERLASVLRPRVLRFGS